MPMNEKLSDAQAQSVAAIWTGLKAHLAERFRQLNSDIRHYPTPIARCDDQLPKLIEQRDHARSELERMTACAAGATASGIPAPEHIAGFLGAATATDDDNELDLRARLHAALAAFPALRIAEWK
jgi:hypothetical protein